MLLTLLPRPNSSHPTRSQPVPAESNGLDGDVVRLGGPKSSLPLCADHKRGTNAHLPCWNVSCRAGTCQGPHLRISGPSLCLEAEQVLSTGLRE